MPRTRHSSEDPTRLVGRIPGGATEGAHVGAGKSPAGSCNPLTLHEPAGVKKGEETKPVVPKVSKGRVKEKKPNPDGPDDRHGSSDPPGKLKE